MQRINQEEVHKDKRKVAHEADGAYEGNKDEEGLFKPDVVNLFGQWMVMKKKKRRRTSKTFGLNRGKDEE